MAFIDNRNYPGGPSAWEDSMWFIPVDTLGNASFTVANWFADGIVLWRMAVIYQTTRIALWKVMILPCMLYAASCILGLLFLLQNSNSALSSPSFDGINWVTPFFSMTIAVNVLLTSAIALRLYLFRRRIASVLGPEHGTQYTSIASMLIESASLSTVFFIVFLTTTQLENPIANIFTQTVPQVQIFATLLIMYRIAQGRGWTNSTHNQVLRTLNSSGGAGDVRMHPLSLHFQSNMPSQSDTATATMGGSRGNVAISKEVLKRVDNGFSTKQKSSESV